MVTIFDLLQALALFIGLIVGATQGHQALGIPGALAGAAIGVLVGWVIGRLPFVLAFAWARRDLKRASTEHLKTRLTREYFSAHLIIAELLWRGEPIASFSDYAKELVTSTQPDKAHFGESLVKMWPELVRQTEGTNE